MNTALLCPTDSPTRSDRMASAIAQTVGISWNDASVLMELATLRVTDLADVSDYDGHTLLWLGHRGLVDLDEGLGMLYVRISAKGAAAVIDGRRAAFKASPSGSQDR